MLLYDEEISTTRIGYCTEMIAYENGCITDYSE